MISHPDDSLDFLGTALGRGLATGLGPAELSLEAGVTIAQLPTGTIVRIHGAYGPGMGWKHPIALWVKRLHEALKKIKGVSLALPPPPVPEHLAFCFVDDAVDAVAIAARGRPGTIYEASSHSPAQDELVRAIGRLMGVKAKLTPGTPVPAPNVPDTAALHALGWSPRFMLDQGLKRTVPWLLDRLQEARRAA